ncbi:MAG TPA: FAD-dependent oxidoreductase, partial [Acidimicrobiia bacterium]
LDAVRTALRLGAAEAKILYRRTEAEMPARVEEVRHAREEGVEFEMLTAPVELLGDDGWLRAARIDRMELGEPDDDGRRRPVTVPGSETEIPVDVLVVAIGNAPNPVLRATSPDLVHTSRGTIAADPDSGRTSKVGVFAGGDIVTGGATVILAMGAGRRAAASICDYLDGGDWKTVSTERIEQRPPPRSGGGGADASVGDGGGLSATEGACRRRRGLNGRSPLSAGAPMRWD